MKKFNLLILVCLVFGVSVSLQAAQKRIALVIGNSQYASSPLTNPTNDATDIAKKLETRGFKVTRLLNATQRQMEDAIREFNRQLGDDTVGLFYFAGHGLEVDGQNYLVPVDATIESEEDVKYESVAAGRLLDGMTRAGDGLNLVILDACRNNPYARSFRGGSRGLAEMRPAKGSLVLYATEPGKLAADGDGRNGIFTQYLLQAMDKPVSVEAAFKETAIEVNKKTDGAQTPWYEGVILGQFSFVSDTQKSVAPAETVEETKPVSSGITVKEDTRLQLELALWQSASDCGTNTCLKDYLDKYPAGNFSTIARERLAAAEKKTKKKAKPSKKSRTIEQKPLDANAIRKLISGKTATVFIKRLKKLAWIYYAPNGTFSFKLRKKKIRHGFWRIKGNQLCQYGEKKHEICGYLKREKHVVKKYDRNDQLVSVYRKFKNGNKL